MPKALFLILINFVFVPQAQLKFHLFSEAFPGHHNSQHSLDIESNYIDYAIGILFLNDIDNMEYLISLLREETVVHSSFYFS